MKKLFFIAMMFVSLNCFSEETKTFVVEAKNETELREVKKEKFIELYREYKIYEAKIQTKKIGENKYEITIKY